MVENQQFSSKPIGRSSVGLLYQNVQYRALFCQPSLKVGVQEDLSCQYFAFFLTFSGSNAGIYARATVATGTVDQGIKLKVMELFFLKDEHK